MGPLDVSSFAWFVAGTFALALARIGVRSSWGTSSNRHYLKKYNNMKFGEGKKNARAKRPEKSSRNDSFQGKRRADSMPQRQHKMNKKRTHRVGFKFLSFCLKMPTLDFRHSKKNDWRRSRFTVFATQCGGVDAKNDRKRRRKNRKKTRTRVGYEK